MRDSRPPLDHPEDARHTVAPHDHAVCTYETPDELKRALRAFVEEGIARRQLVVFVHSFASDDEAWSFIRDAAPESIESARDIIMVSLYTTAFEGDARRIDYEHVGRVLGGLQEQAARTGKEGTRIFVDASRTYFAGGRMEEWFAFESWLGVRLQDAAGLVCAYQRSDIMKEHVLPQVLRTHAYRFDAPKERTGA